MMHHKLLLVSFFLFILSVSALAVTDQERAELKRLHTELKALLLIIDTAERAGNDNDRRQINYQQLRNDLDIILNGIDDAVNAKRREPRSLPSLEGSYL